MAIDVFRHPFARILIGLITVYRYTLSPAFSALGVRCRHAPSCSEYAIEAVRRHGAWAGAWMAAARLQRCHPWGTHGHDPAPETLPEAARWWTPWRYGDWRGPAKPSVDSTDKAEQI
ncbi:MAG: membrane protein insertion efficiency factor YidD [Maricaulaceae bacterium]